MSSSSLIVDCPQCGKAVEWGGQSPFRPFCSKRCQLIDLGEWANEEKSIPGHPDLEQDFENFEDPGSESNSGRLEH